MSYGPALPYRETVETFGRHGSLAGILTHPGRDRGGTPVVLLGAGIIHKVGPSRTSVEVARLLATAGHPTLRFDLSGIGDSPRVHEDSMEETAVRDVQDAISLVEERVSTPDGVAVVGFCSGADNGLFVAARDPRVSRLVLFDPTVHRTRGFDRRRRARRLTSPRSWWNVLSGRSLALELKDRMAVDAERPPGFYGLLTQSPEETDRRVAQLVSRGVPILYVLSSGTHGYCNGPEQIEESLPTGFDPAHVRVVWAPDMDHILSTARQRRALADAVLEHLSGDPGPAGG